jgi:predicted alpha/beta hydrolase family esterase
MPDPQPQPHVLLVPGIGNSGPDHWQRHWQRDRGYTVVEQREWEAPLRDDWVAELERVVAATPGPLVLAGHSAACGTIAAFSAVTAHAGRIRGALLVGPSDTEGPNYPTAPRGFAPMPRRRLPFASIAVLSSNDPYVSLERGRAFAADWGSEVVEIGAAGHINVASGHGPWPAGLALLDRFLK